MQFPISHGLGGRASAKPVERRRRPRPRRPPGHGLRRRHGAGAGKEGLGVDGVVEAALRSQRGTAADTVREIHRAVLAASRGRADGRRHRRLPLRRLGLAPMGPAAVGEAVEQDLHRRLPVRLVQLIADLSHLVGRRGHLAGRGPELACHVSDRFRDPRHAAATALGSQSAGPARAHQPGRRRWLPQSASAPWPCAPPMLRRSRPRAWPSRRRPPRCRLPTGWTVCRSLPLPLSDRSLVEDLSDALGLVADSLDVLGHVLRGLAQPLARPGRRSWRPTWRRAP